MKIKRVKLGELSIAKDFRREINKLSDNRYIILLKADAFAGKIELEARKGFNTVVTYPFYAPEVLKELILGTREVCYEHFGFAWTRFHFDPKQNIITFSAREKPMLPLDEIDFIIEQAEFPQALDDLEKWFKRGLNVAKT